MSDSFDPSPWTDPNVKDALADWRQPSDIALITCPLCMTLGYYNEGSHWTCRNEACGYHMSGEDLDEVIELGDVTTLADYEDGEREDLPELVLTDDKDASMSFNPATNRGCGFWQCSACGRREEFVALGQAVLPHKCGVCGGDCVVA